MKAKIYLDPITLDIIENALRNIRHEMDAVVFRSAMSPVIREQHDAFPMVCTPDGRMVVGQFGSYIAGFIREWRRGIKPGDVFLTSDPYKCQAAISHINDWLVLLPIFFEGELVGWASQFGHTLDVGGPVPGSLPTDATTIFGEGVRIPPVKLFDQGRLNEDVLDLILNNSRTPTMNYFDLMAIVAGCRTAEKRVQELCERFGKETVLEAFEALLDRTYRAMSTLIVRNLPEEPVSFEDYVDDDGRGNGPYKMKLTIWREGDHGYFDWTGTDPQAPGPINFYLSEEMFKMFIGVYLIMVYDPQILFNDGFYPLLHIILPEGCLLRPKFPAALGCRTHALARLFDVLGGALGVNAPELSTAAGYGTSPYLLYNGYDERGEFFHLMEITFGGIPGRPMGDGLDAHSWWPLFENIPTEYLENYYPLTVLEYGSLRDSGGAGFHRGGNGVHKVYRFEADGEIAIHDDRERSQPWGILGGLPGECSRKLLIRTTGERIPLPSKISQVPVRRGDVLIYQTAGGGGWKDPLDRPAERVRMDVIRGLVSREKAERDYGVVLDPTTWEIDWAATENRRRELRQQRGPIPIFTFGPAPEPIGVMASARAAYRAVADP
ncbi:MAG: hydantoinase B/oxoprolinase family protein [Blastocatellia bacterium]|nr:hydantoinase B/oxoprolinase family protein [Blastocatellia bacterium]MDW8166884.1 hydantoinase B/oxoprolinase family protein [Acidobacteriota bacterium]